MNAEDTLLALTGWLHAFDAKERNHVLTHFLGGEKGRFDDGIKTTLQKVSPGIEDLALNGLEVRFQCMDYHLDWIWAALTLTRMKLRGFQTDQFREVFPLDEASWQVLAGDARLRKEGTKFLSPNFTQQDADWLVLAFEPRADKPRLWFFLFECKYANPWGSKQLAGKLVRLRKFVDAFPDLHGLEIRFQLVLLSDDRPSSGVAKNAEKLYATALGLDPGNVTDLVKGLPWVRLEGSRAEDHHHPYKVTRCNQDKVKDGNGAFWGVLPRQEGQEP